MNSKLQFQEIIKKFYYKKNAKYIYIYIYMK